MRSMSGSVNWWFSKTLVTEARKGFSITTPASQDTLYSIVSFLRRHLIDVTAWRCSTECSSLCLLALNKWTIRVKILNPCKSRCILPILRRLLVLGKCHSLAICFMTVMQWMIKGIKTTSTRRILSYHLLWYLRNVWHYLAICQR